MIEAYFDGSCDPNPGGPIGLGACIIEDGIEIFTYHHFVSAAKNNTNNVAEYMALEVILATVLEMDADQITVCGDSQMVIGQMHRRSRISGEGKYVPHGQRCRDLLDALDEKMTIRFQWIPRERNTRADELSKQHLQTV